MMTGPDRYDIFASELCAASGTHVGAITMLSAILRAQQPEHLDARAVERAIAMLVSPDLFEKQLVSQVDEERGLVRLWPGHRWEYVLRSSKR